MRMHGRIAIWLRRRGRCRALGEAARGLIARDAATRARPVYAACAVDALGIPLLLGRDAAMRSRDPASEAPIRIAVRAGAATWNPPGAVVTYCDPRRTAAGPDPCCGAIHFFATPEWAGAYLRAHAGPGGRVLAPAEALAIAGRRFGDLLAGEGPLACRCR